MNRRGSEGTEDRVNVSCVISLVEFLMNVLQDNYFPELNFSKPIGKC